MLVLKIALTLVLTTEPLRVSRSGLEAALVSALTSAVHRTCHGIGTGREGAMARDWDAVAAAIRARMVDLDMTQAELSQRAGVALMTVRELQNNLKPRRRNPRTLAAVSEALGWPPEHLTAILGGADPEDPDAGDLVLAELDEIKEQLTAIASRLDAVERWQAAADERP